MGLGDLLHPLPLGYPSPSLSHCPAQHSTGNTTTPPHRLAYHHNTHRPILSPFLQLPYLEHPSPSVLAADGHHLDGPPQHREQQGERAASGRALKRWASREKDEYSRGT